MNRKVVVLIILFCILIIITGGLLYVFKKPGRDVSKEKETFEIKATKLYSEYQENETKANAKYLDKTILVKGQLIEKGDNYIIIGSKKASINCSFAGNYSYNIEGMKINGNIKIKGVCTGLNLFDVTINKCVIINKNVK